MSGEAAGRAVNCGESKRTGNAMIRCALGPEIHAWHWDSYYSIEWRHHAPVHQSRLGTIHSGIHAGQTTVDDQIADTVRESER